MKKFEYKTVQFEDHDSIERRLIDLGEQGWDLVSILGRKSGKTEALFAVFKRELQRRRGHFNTDIDD